MLWQDFYYQLMKLAKCQPLYLLHIFEGLRPMSIIINVRESNSVIYIFASPLKCGLHSKERICSSWSKFFPLRVSPRAMSARGANTWVQVQGKQLQHLN